MANTPSPVVLKSPKEFTMNASKVGSVCLGKQVNNSPVASFAKANNFPIGSFAKANKIIVMLALLTQSVCAQAQDASSGLVPFWDARIRLESTRDFPAPRDNIHRSLARVHLGALYMGVEGWEFGASTLMTADSDNPRDNRRNFDNQRSNSVALDQFYARWQSSALSVQFGKTSLPMTLTPLVWDADLRPIGLSIASSTIDDAGTGFSYGAGYFAPDFIFDNEKPRLAAAQLGWHWQQGQSTSFSVLAAYLRFSALDRLPANGIGRTNRRLGANFLSDYELLDLQLIGRTRVLDRPLTLTLDGVDNRGAKTLNRAGRVSLALGDASEGEGGLELGVAYQRNARDAILAIAADNDWWFQSFSRGTMPWISYGFSPNTRVRLALTDERRDGIVKSTKRALLDVITQW
jgi:hypothetical protein